MVDEINKSVLVVLNFAVCGCVIGISGLMIGRQQVDSIWRGIVAPLVMGAVAGMGGAIAGSWEVAGAGMIPVGIGVGLFAIQRWHRAIARAWMTLAGKPGLRGGVCLLLVPLFAGWVSYQQDRFMPSAEIDIQEPLFDDWFFVGRVFSNDLASVPAATDRGEQFFIFTPDLRIEPEHLAHSREANILAPYRDRVMRTAPMDSHYNCHGWVFADGQGWLSGPAVQMILRDNDYRLISAPQAGDLAVYFRGDDISHTGVVRIADPAGAVIVESKWSLFGRFLHSAADQPFGEEVRYYRAARLGHSVRRGDSTSTVGYRVR